MSDGLLDQIISRLEGLPPDQMEAIAKETLEATKDDVFIPTPGPQTEAYFSKADILLFGGAPGGGKALDLTTPLATPTGWVTMGDIKVGDTLFDESGGETNVVAISKVMKGRKCYTVKFSDGSEIVADAEHLWNTQTRTERNRALKSTEAYRDNRKANRSSRGKGVKPWLSEMNSKRAFNPLPFFSTRTTQEINDTLLHSDGRLNHSIEVAQPIKCDSKRLLVNPYVLGAWLGDGTSASGGFTTADIVMITYIKSVGYKVTNHKQVYSYGILGLQVQLRALGLLRNKHIPSEYLRASIDQRKELLRGLMDTDGYADPRGQCEFTTTSERLSIDFMELVWSLGIKAAISEGRAMLNGKDCGAKYRIKFMAPFPAFRLKRKLARQKIDGFRPTVNRRYIVSVDEVESVPVKCVAVDGDSKLYLAGRGMIPTHNSALGLGLARNEHYRTLVLRKNFSDLDGIIDNGKKIYKTDKGFVGGMRPKCNLPNGGVIHFAGVAKDGGIGGHQGVDHDLIYIDEVAQFQEDQVRLHLAWLRTDREGQRCRVVFGSNPPLDTTGDWLIPFFAPWLDEKHNNPAEPGELRWFLPDEHGKDFECKEDDSTFIGGEEVFAQSRTFIPSRYTDNPYYDPKEYAKTLATLPPEVREILVTGNFMLGRQDNEYQAIPTAWVKSAMERWCPDPPAGVPMCAIGVDPAGGGKDDVALAPRYDGWYAPIIAKPGRDFPHGKGITGLVITERRDGAKIVLDMGGGYGSLTYEQLKENDVDVSTYLGSEKSVRRTEDGKIKFTNKRTEAYWRFREALDPEQASGSPIALPDDPELLSDLCSPTYEITGAGIKLETKKKLVERLGRSPNKGDAVIMAWYDGAKAISHRRQWEEQGIGKRGRAVPKVITKTRRKNRK